MTKRLTLDEFKYRAKAVHGEKYSYEKSIYSGYNEKLTITCPIHGDFMQTPHSHLDGCGCKECRKITLSKKLRKSQEWFLKKANEKQGDKYDLSKAKYIKNNAPITVICHIKDCNGIEHGEFVTTPNSFLDGKGCPKCAREIRAEKNSKIKYSFKENLEKRWKNDYSFSNFEYNGYDKKSIVHCNICGNDFLSSYHILMNNEGCPYCRMTKLEKEIDKECKSRNIKTIYQFSIKDGGRKRYDFFLPKYNTIIECQGEQHFNGIDFSKNKNTSLDLLLKQQVLRDDFKYKIAIKNNYKIIYYTKSSLFHNKEIEIHNQFYKDKLIFEDAGLMLDEIIKKEDDK